MAEPGQNSVPSNFKSVRFSQGSRNKSGKNQKGTGENEKYIDCGGVSVYFRSFLVNERIQRENQKEILDLLRPLLPTPRERRNLKASNIQNSEKI